MDEFKYNTSDEGKVLPCPILGGKEPLWNRHVPYSLSQINGFLGPWCAFCVFARSGRWSLAEVGGSSTSSQKLAGQEGDVEAGVVVSAPRAITATATAYTPHLSRSLVWSAGEVAMRAVFGSGVLAVKAALGGVGLVDVDDLEVVANEELADA